MHGAPVLLSWSGTMFEYLMPLLLMRSYPETLLDESCRLAVRRQIDYGASLGVPWGISESAYGVVDRHETYQYKAFGVPGLGPDARPRRRTRGCAHTRRRWRRSSTRIGGRQPASARARRGARRVRLLRGGRLTCPARAIRRRDRPSAAPGVGPGTVVRAYMSHHQGMMLVALANVLLRRRDGRAGSTAIRGCGPPSCCCRSGCRAPPPDRRPRGRPRRCACRRR